MNSDTMGKTVEIYVRLIDGGMDFVYSLKRGDAVLESGRVPAAGQFRAPAIPGYHRRETYPAPGPNDLELWGNLEAAQVFHSALYGHSR